MFTCLIRASAFLLGSIELLQVMMNGFPLQCKEKFMLVHKYVHDIPEVSFCVGSVHTEIYFTSRKKKYIYIDFHLANETSFTYLEELLVVLDN